MHRVCEWNMHRKRKKSFRRWAYECFLTGLTYFCHSSGVLFLFHPTTCPTDNDAMQPISLVKSINPLTSAVYIALSPEMCRVSSFVRAALCFNIFGVPCTFLPSPHLRLLGQLRLAEGFLHYCLAVCHPGCQWLLCPLIRRECDICAEVMESACN